MRNPEIVEPIKTQIDELLDISGQFYRAGDLEKSLNIALEAWDKIPEPKFKWDYYAQNLSVGFVIDYVSLGNIEKAKMWIEHAYQAYNDENRESIYVLFIEGEALYNLDIKDEAYDVFDRIYKLSGKQWFKGDHSKFLSFYLDEKKRRDLNSVNDASSDDTNLNDAPSVDVNVNGDLPDDIYDLVLKHSEKGNLLIDAENYWGSIDEWNKALSVIPSPKFIWDATFWLYASIGEAYRNLDKIPEALEAFQSAYKCSGGAQNAFVPYGIGACLFDLNRKEECSEFLLKAYMLEGELLFQDENAKYLQPLIQKGYI